MIIDMIRQYIIELLKSDIGISKKDIFVKNTRQNKEFNKDKYRMSTALIWTEREETQKLSDERYDGGAGSSYLYKRTGYFIIEIIDTIANIENKVDLFFYHIDELLEFEESNVELEIRAVEREEIDNNIMSASIHLNYILLSKNYNYEKCKNNI